MSYRTVTREKESHNNENTTTDKEIEHSPHHTSGITPEEGWPAYIANVAVAGTFMAIFIGVFYFTVAKNIEQTVVEKNVDIIVDNITGNISALVGQTVINDNYNAISTNLTLSPDAVADLAQQDAQITNNNNALLDKATWALGSVAIVGLCIVIGCWFLSRRAGQKAFSIPRILGSNLLLLCFVGLTYWLFLLTVASNYQSADVNLIKANMVHTAIVYGTPPSS